MLAKLSRQWRKQAREQNWFLVVVDLAIVFVGVFLGIQAANWNEARKERAEERRYYVQLIDDLRADQQTLLVAERRSRQFDEAAEQVLQALQNGIAQGMAPGRLAVQLHYAGYLYLPRPARMTYDELVSTGSVGLLRNQRAKAAIAQYYAEFDEYRQWDGLLRQQQDRYWKASAGILPRQVLQAALVNEEPILNPSQAEDILKEARARPEIRMLLIGMAAHQARVRRDSKLMAENGRALIAMLEPLSH